MPFDSPLPPLSFVISFTFAETENPPVLFLANSQLETIHLEELHREERRNLEGKESRIAKLDFDGFEKELKGTVKERKKANRQMSKDEVRLDSPPSHPKIKFLAGFPSIHSCFLEFRSPGKRTCFSKPSLRDSRKT